MSCHISRCWLSQSTVMGCLCSSLSHLITNYILLNTLLLSTCDFPFTGNWRLLPFLFCLRLDWLPEFKPDCDWSIPRTRLGCERQKQIRAGASPNKDQRSVSIPHVACYPLTTHRDIPLLSQKKHKYTFTAFVFQQQCKCNMVMCELSEFSHCLGWWKMLKAYFIV